MTVAFIGMLLMIVYLDPTIRSDKSKCERSDYSRERVAALVYSQSPSPPDPTTTYEVNSEFRCALEYRPYDVGSTVFIYVNMDQTQCAYERDSSANCEGTQIVFIIGMISYAMLCILFPCYRRSDSYCAEDSMV